MEMNFSIQMIEVREGIVSDASDHNIWSDDFSWFQFFSVECILILVVQWISSVDHFFFQLDVLLIQLDIF